MMSFCKCVTWGINSVDSQICDNIFLSCLPNDLVGAVRQSGEASASFVNSGGTRAIVRATE